MPDAAKKPHGNAKADLKAPLIGSPTKSKSNATAGKPAEKEVVKLPSIGTSPGSPSKKSIKSESAPTALPNSAPSKVSTPTSPVKTKEPPSGSPHRGSKATKTSNDTQSSSSDKVSSPPLAPDCVDTPEQPLAEETSSGSSQQELSLSAEADALAALAAADAAAAEAVAKAEADRIRKENGNGMIQLIYEQYDELFPITDGSTTQAAIDDVYCLSFVMPNCLVHLSIHPNAERFDRENSGIFDSLVHEEPRGVYHDLVKDQIYYVVVEQEEDQLRRDQEATKAKWAPAVKSDKEKKDDGRGFESCSCVYGNPCADEYGCKDWHSRFAIATANGWKGF